MRKGDFLLLECVFGVEKSGGTVWKTIELTQCFRNKIGNNFHIQMAIRTDKFLVEQLLQGRPVVGFSLKV